MSVEISQHDINNYREAFRLFDVDNDGTITLIELKEVLETIGYTPSDQELHERLKEVDTGGYGAITFNDFMAFVAAGKHDIEDNEMIGLFHVFDLDQSGYIRLEEFKIVLKRLGFIFTDKQVEAMLTFADTGGDGRICYDEFIKANDSRVHNLPQKRKRLPSVIVDSQIEKYKAAFQLVDVNDNGHVTFEEMKQILKTLGLKLKDNYLKERLKEIDQRGNDHISFDEFISVVLASKHDVEELEMIKAFLIFDADESGYVSNEVLAVVLKQLGFVFTEKQIEVMLQYADMHGDEQIDYKEFVKVNDFRLHKH